MPNFYLVLSLKKSWNGPKVGEIFEQIVKFQIFQSSLCLGISLPSHLFQYRFCLDEPSVDSPGPLLI